MRARVARILGVAAVVLLGAWLRAHRVQDVGLAMDEAGTLWAARGDSAAETLHRVSACHHQGALYYLVVRATLALLGETEATLRLPSLVAGSLVPLLGFAAARRAAGARAAGAVLALLAVDPALVIQSRSARPYALAELGTVLALAGLAFALRSGSARARAALWGGAALAVHAHGIFFTIVPALLAAVAVARAPLYGVKDARRDAALALAVMLPQLVAMTRVFMKRSELAWVGVVDTSVLSVLLPRGTAIPAAIALGYVLLRRPGFAGPADRGACAFVLGTLATVLASVLALLALGTNVLVDRYLSAAIVLAPVLAGRLLAALPRPLAAAGLLVAVALGSSSLSVPTPANEWREAAAYLDELAARETGPILLNPGFVEQGSVLQPGGPGPERSAFIASPFEQVPGRPEPRRAYVLLPKSLENTPAHVDYFEREVTPRLAASRSFVIVGRPAYVGIVEDWLARRLPAKRFRVAAAREFPVREFATPLRVARYEEAP